MTKYIVTTGGVISGVGKGIVTSSVSLLLKSSGVSVTAMKIDPYLNVDAGTINPFDHGEVFVLEDGTEVDQDLGNYERFLGTTLSSDNILTTGKVYQKVISAERRGDYLGKTVQIVPHITDQIKADIKRAGLNYDVCLIELGGTVGDIESAPFLEALRQLSFEVGRSNFCLMHVSLIPFVGEQKSKPTQSSVRTLQSMGLVPDILVCRSVDTLQESIRRKLSVFCNVTMDQIISVVNCDTIYRVPLLLREQNLLGVFSERLELPLSYPDLLDWQKLLVECTSTIRIGIFGKYNSDTYLSLNKAIEHACLAKCIKPCIEYVTDHQFLESFDGIIVPGGFGVRMSEGKIRAISIARTKKIPFLGICLGFQLAVVEFARNVCGIENANSVEMTNDNTNVIIQIPTDTSDLGGSMKLGSRVTRIKEGTRAMEIYKESEITERHRHRYEVNSEYIPMLSDASLVFSGTDSSGTRMNILELSDHPFFVATQFHPEFKTKPNEPTRVFTSFVESILLGNNNEFYKGGASKVV